MSEANLRQTIRAALDDAQFADIPSDRRAVLAQDYVWQWAREQPGDESNKGRTVDGRRSPGRAPRGSDTSEHCEAGEGVWRRDRRSRTGLPLGSDDRQGCPGEASE